MIFFRKPLHTFRDHALASSPPRQARYRKARATMRTHAATILLTLVGSAALAAMTVVALAQGVPRPVQAPPGPQGAAPGTPPAPGGVELIDPAVLRVCADPNNMPFSNEAGEGFENKIAALLAKEL